MEATMHVELALFDGNDLLERGCVSVGTKPTTTSFRLFHAHHSLGPNGAEIVLEGFDASAKIRRAVLDMPVHDSEDWESIELGDYTLGFRCRVEA